MVPPKPAASRAVMGLPGVLITVNGNNSGDGFINVATAIFFMGWKIITVFVLLLAAALYMSFPAGGFMTAEPTVCIRGNCFNVEVALTQEQKSRGLMFREHIDDDKGMLFLYSSEAPRPFWMKNTLVPLDIIWISCDNHIVSIAREAQPCETDPCPIITPEGLSRNVLEINGGMSDRLGITEGDEVIFYGIAGN